MNVSSVVLIVVFHASLAATTFAQDEQPKLNQPTRPGTARSADIQRAGVLQIELGLDSRLHSPEIHSAASTPVSVRYALVPSVALDAIVEPLVSEVDQEARTRHTAFGDTVVGGQWVGRDESASAPALAIAYYVKMPTASDSQDIGTGRVDHRLMFLGSKSIGAVDVDLTVAYLNVGQRESGRSSGALAAVSASQEFKNHFGYIAEWAHQTEDAELPRGGYALAAITYRINNATRFDAGARFGLTHAAPDVGVTTGLSVSTPAHLKR